MYTPKLWSSIERYIDTRSALASRNVAPIVVNRIIIGYSGIVAHRVVEPVGLLSRRVSPFVLPRSSRLEDQGSRINAPVTSRNTSIDCVTVVA